MNQSLTRILITFCLLMLGVLEFLWLQHEYKSKRQEMESQLTHLMFSTLRDVEDSLIMVVLADQESNIRLGGEGNREFDISIRVEDSTVQAKDTFTVATQSGAVTNVEKRGPMRGSMMKRFHFKADSLYPVNFSLPDVVMGKIRAADSTGEFEGYHVLTFHGRDTFVPEAMSRPQWNFISGERMALSNKNYKADILTAMIPHFGFALFLWLTVAAAFIYIYRSLRKQMALNALRDEFVSNITHELKTPITTVGVALESLSHTSGHHDQTSRTYLDICRNELNRLTLLVDRILMQRSPQLHLEPLDVKDVISDVVRQMEMNFKNRNANVKLKMDATDLQIKGDRQHLSSVMVNLLENALKYSPENPFIHVVAERQNGHVLVNVEDHGIGIDPMYHDRIFDKLFRVPNSNRHDVKGHGLGLSYVADIVKQHGGEISLASSPGKGSTFSIRFPAIHEN